MRIGRRRARRYASCSTAASHGSSCAQRRRDPARSGVANGRSYRCAMPAACRWGTRRWCRKWTRCATGTPRRGRVRATGCGIGTWPPVDSGFPIRGARSSVRPRARNRRRSGSSGCIRGTATQSTAPFATTSRGTRRVSRASTACGTRTAAGAGCSCGVRRRATRRGRPCASPAR